jgi:hypothetical protein
MLILALTTDKIQAVGSTGADLDVHASWTDLSGSSVTPGRTNTAITAAATTDIVAAPASSTYRNVKTINVRNRDAALSCDVAIVFNQNGTQFELHKATLRPGDLLEYVEGVGWFTVQAAAASLINESTTSQTLSTTDAYLVGSSILLPSGMPIVGTLYRCLFDVAKTAGTGSPVVTVRFGTAGAVGDVARNAFTFGVGTSVADTATFAVTCLFRSVGSGTSAVIQGNYTMIPNLATTGFGGTTPIRSGQNTGGGFDSTVAASIIGVSFNGSTAFAGTVQLVRAELVA